MKSFTESSKGSALQAYTNEYTELKQLIRQEGLLDKQPIYYIYKILLTLGMLALSLAFLVVLGNSRLQLLNAVFLAFIFAQIGFIGHDSCHRQILRTAWKSDILSLILGNLLIGLSRGWWTDKHNRHHGNPNQLDLDPDIDIPILAFSEEQACSKQGLLRFMVKFQAYYFFLILSAEAFYMRLYSIQFLLQKKVKYRLAEILLLTTHFVLYFGMVFFLVGGWNAVLFILIHQAFLGLNLGMSFAANHKGMLMLERDSKIDFLHRQVLTARNLKANPITDFMFGSLSCQIEHHLFPGMPRNKLRTAAKIVKPFCQERSIAYSETGVLQSYREILQYLHQVGAPLRKEKEKERR